MLRIPRGITRELAVLLLLTGIVPMAAVSIFAYFKAAGPMTRGAISFYVERVARDTAERLDNRIDRSSRAAESLATLPAFAALCAELDGLNENSDEYLAALEQIQLNLDSHVREDVDLIAVVDDGGAVLVTSSLVRPAPETGTFATDEGRRRTRLWDEVGFSNPLRGTGLDKRGWWEGATSGPFGFIDWQDEPLVQTTYAYPESIAGDEPTRNPEFWTFGHVHEVAPIDEDGVRKLVVFFYNWSAIQDLLDDVNSEFQKEHPQYKSGYTFLFGQDLDTIIGHHDRSLYGKQLTRDFPDEQGELLKLRRTMQQAPGGSGTCAYEYIRPKISGFAAVDSVGWRLGFGINEENIYVEVEDLRNFMIITAVLVALVIVILTSFLARMITEPIKLLISQTRDIARGNLDARVELTARDELSDLGDSFNRMAEDLKATNRRLIQAEKEAAWREMAQQVAHEIKNPLTPMKLSAQLIERAYREDHPDFGELLEQSTHSIVAQVESLTKIASDFSSYAAFPRTDRQPESVHAIVEEAVTLYQNRGQGVDVHTDLLFGPEVLVSIDRDELRRVFINVLNNAFDALDEKGSIRVSGAVLDGAGGHRVVELRFADTGAGIPADVVDRLFEPYFTTRSSGTGLGLAISKKTIEGSGGTIDINSEKGRGTTVRIVLPVHAEA